jgi:cell division protein FtsL
MTEEDLEDLFEDDYMILSAKASISTIHFLRSRIVQLEKVIAKAAKLKNEYELRLIIQSRTNSPKSTTKTKLSGMIMMVQI